MAASIVQHLAHIELANVTPTVGKYGMPSSILFRYIVCPHYLAEIVLYISLTILVPTPLTLLVLIFVLVNLTDTALATLSWYMRLFPFSQLHSPRRRYAILPCTL